MYDFEPIKNNDARDTVMVMKINCHHLKGKFDGNWFGEMNENIFVKDKTVSEKKLASDLVYLKRKTDVGYYFNAIIKKLT